MMIYLDNAATTKPDEECLDMAAKYLKDEFYNPSGVYTEGFNLKKEINAAKEKMLSFLCPQPDKYEMIITSGGTEADNLAVFSGSKRGNIITTQGEHAAVYSSFLELKTRGTDVRLCALKKDGTVDEDELLSLVDDNTSLVSLIHVNNETGAINDINSIAKHIKQKNRNCLVHSDGVQAFGKIKYKLSQDVDMYSLSAHKIGAVKGCGALIKRKNLSIKPLIYGGGQESGMRSGTENVFGIMDMYFCAEKRYKALGSNFEHVKKLNGIFRDNLDKSLFSVVSPDGSSPYILCVLAGGVRGEIILHEANDQGIILGTGSACSSNEKKRYSRVLLSMAISQQAADGALRISFSPSNTEDEAQIASKELNRIVANRKGIMSL